MFSLLGFELLVLVVVVVVIFHLSRLNMSVVYTSVLYST